MAELAREALIALCEGASVDMTKWRDRDSAAAQRQIGEALALLKAGARVRFPSDPKSDARTIWIYLSFPGFRYFDEDGPWDEDLFYIPTQARLDASGGRDWY